MTDKLILDGLSDENLEKVMFERLHGNQTIGPPVELRGDYSSFDWLIEQYNKGSQNLQDKMAMIAEKFLMNIIDQKTWPANARFDLLDMIQELKIGIEVLEKLIREQKIYNALGPLTHAALLKLSLELGQKRSKEFWLQQLELLGDDYGTLIFGGLLEEGLQTAAEYLPQCCSSEKAARYMRLIMPELINDYGLKAIREAMSKKLPLLPGTSRKILEDALKL